MTSTPLDRQLKTQANPKKEYRALIRSLKYREGFGLLFVQCSPAGGTHLIGRVRQDLPQKRIEVLSLTEPVDTLYDKVEALYQLKPIEILFVQGIEHSLYAYESSRLWQDDAQRWNYSETAVPRLLQHLNLSHERFWESFPIHFVFLVPPFALKYLIRRAPDFFDWNSGVLELPMEKEELRQESERVSIQRLSIDDPQNLPTEECRRSLLDIQALLEEPYQADEQKADLLFEQARLFQISGSEEEATASFNKALQLNPNKDSAWNSRGIALRNLGRYEEAIASYDKALQLNPNDYSAWNNRGNALSNLGRHEKAIASYDKALQLNPNNPNVFYNKAYSYVLQANLDAALANLSKAIELDPKKYREMAKTDSDFDSIRENERFQALLTG